jgi:transcription termination/antitermination protein NusA
VPDFQLSLAIGREGQNARLAARLTGWRVDIKSETQRAEEDAGIFRSDERYEREEGVEYAEGEWVPNAATGELEWHAADGTVVSAQEWAAGGEAEEASPTDTPPDEVEASPSDATPEEVEASPTDATPEEASPSDATAEEVEASPTDATAEEAAGASEDAAEAALDEEAAIEANLDPIQDAFDAEDAERSDEGE